MHSTGQLAEVGLVELREIQQQLLTVGPGLRRTSKLGAISALPIEAGSAHFGGRVIHRHTHLRPLRQDDDWRPGQLQFHAVRIRATLREDIASCKQAGLHLAVSDNVELCL